MENKIKLTNVTIFLIVAYPLFLISSFNSNSAQFRVLGLVAILSLLALSGILLLRHLLLHKSINKHIFKILIPIVILTVLFTLSCLIDPTIASVSNLLKFLGAMSLLLFFSLIEWNSLRIKIVVGMSVAALAIMPFITDILFAGPHYAFLLFFVWMSKLNKFIKILLSAFCLYFIYISDARAVLLLVAAFFATYVLWTVIAKNKFLYNSYLAIIMSVLMAFIFIYPNLIYYQWFQSLNVWFIQNTGARLNSGRDVIWAKLTDAIMQQPFLGHGLGATASQVTDQNLSSHNLYVQIAFQSGLIALSVYIILIFVIWNIYFINKKDKITRLSASFLVGILIYSSFEVILIQNKMDTATMFWLIISVGISRVIYKNTKTQTD